jgi:hypothetical protein
MKAFFESTPSGGFGARPKRAQPRSPLAPRAGPADKPGDRVAARPGAPPPKIEDRSRLLSVDNDELQALKHARAEGRLRQYRVIETGGKRSIVELDGDEQIAIAKLVAKSGAFIDRHPERLAPPPPPAPSPRAAGTSGARLASRRSPRAEAPPEAADLPA